MTTNHDKLVVLASTILNNVRSEPEYRRLNAAVDNGCEESLYAQTEYFDRRVTEELNKLPVATREAVNVIINERLARACGLI